MSVYFGGEKVGINYPVNVTGAVLSDNDIAQLNDAVNYRVKEFTTKTLPQMIERMKQKYFIDARTDLEIMGSSFSTWIRPASWPDLDSLNLQQSGSDYIYMTYDANKDISAIALYVLPSSGSVTVTRGHINNGSYVVDETIANNGSNQYIEWLDNITGYPVVRVTGNIRRCYCITVTNTNGQQQNHRQQPIVERIAYVPNLQYFVPDNNYSWGTFYLEREKIGNGTGTALTGAYRAYRDCFRLRSLDISGLYTPNVTNFLEMFYNCRTLPITFDLRHWSVSKATTFNNMFYGCSSISSINLTGWNTEKLTSTGLNNMFDSCYNLKRIYGIENFYTNNCTQLTNVFSNCRSLQQLDLSNWNTNKVTTFVNLFYDCFRISDLSFVKNWRTPVLTNLSNTFANCYLIEELDLHEWDVSHVTNVYYLFGGCRALKKLNITGWVINSTTSLAYTFLNCHSLEYIDISNWHITNTCTSIYQAFYSCFSLKELNIPEGWNLSGLGTGSVFHNLFANCYSLKSITGISNWNMTQVCSWASIFANCYSLETLDISNWDFSLATSTASMFTGCYSLKQLTMSYPNISANCTSTNNMFSACYSLKTLDVSGYITTNVTNMTSMFSSCWSLKSIGNINSWNVAKVTTFDSMFRYCYSLNQAFNLSNWNMSTTTTIQYMFAECYALESFTANNWNLAKCTTMVECFRYCYSLKTLSISGWQLPKLSTAPGAFLGNCFSLEIFSGIACPLNINFLNTYCLTHQSLINLLNELPTVTTTRTINIYSYNFNRLTDAEKAIAQNKGWTIAA